MSVGHQRRPVAEAQRLLKVGGQIEKGDALSRVVGEDPLELGQLAVADKGVRVFQHNQAAASHHGFQQLHHKALEGGQLVDVGVRPDGHADLLNERGELFF